MFFVNWLFGKQETQPEVVDTAPVPESKKEKTIFKAEAVINALGCQVKNLQERQRKLEINFKLSRAEAKKFVASGEQAEARKHAIKAVKNQKESDSCSLRKKILVQKMFQLEQAWMDMETIASLKRYSPNEDKQEQAYEFEDENQQNQSSKIVESEIDLKMVEERSDDEDVDILLTELANEVQNEKEQKVEGEKKENIELTEQAEKKIDNEQLPANL